MCAAILVETLTGEHFPPEKAAEFSIKNGARVSTVTDMNVLSKALSQTFGFKVTKTDKAAALLEALKQGSIAVANVDGDRSGYRGVFSDGGHYVIVFGIAPDGRLILADPYRYAGKYEKSYRKVVEVAGDLLYAAPEVLDKDAANRSPRYTIFTGR